MRRVKERLKVAAPWLAGVTAACSLPATFFSQSHAKSDYAVVKYKPEFIRVSPRESLVEKRLVLDKDVSDLLLHPYDSHSLPSASVISLPSLPRYSSASYSSLQKKLFREGSEIVDEFLATRTIRDFTADLVANGWEPCTEMAGDDYQSIVLRRRFLKGDKEVCRYCILGESTIPTETLHALLCDADYRPKWDESAQSVVSSQKDPITSSITLEWESKWPWPLAARRYLFRQTPFVSGNARGVVCAGLPVQTEGGAVAVEDYTSISVISPVNDGSKFCLFYFDDPQLGQRVPQWLENYAARTLIPGFTRSMVEGGKRFPEDRLSTYRNSAASRAAVNQNNNLPHPWEKRHTTTS